MASDHWLWRFDAAAWLAAANTELVQARQRQDARRSCLTHLRRAAGMALNAVLVACFPESEADTVWGRSYVDHLRAVAGQGPIPAPLATQMDAAALREACALLMNTPLLPGTGRGERLVKLRARESDDVTGPCITATAELLEACARACAPG